MTGRPSPFSISRALKSFRHVLLMTTLTSPASHNLRSSLMACWSNIDGSLKFCGYPPQAAEDFRLHRTSSMSRKRIFTSHPFVSFHPK